VYEYPEVAAENKPAASTPDGKAAFAEVKR
jgi:hypothetical protein